MTVWLLWRTWWSIRSSLERKSLVGVFASYAAAICATGGLESYDVEEVQVQA